ncbi:phosphatidylglycerophosphatase A, partial [Acinetobacter baumannii]
VWDEIIAIWLVLVVVMPTDTTGQMLAVFLFRFFDMLKPGPVRYIERRVKGGLGVMIDDIMAAFLTLLVIAVWQFI